MPRVKSPKISDITRHDDIRIPVDDELVAATRYEPNSQNNLPALLLFYPYRKDDYLTFGAYSPTIEYLASQGYEVVTADILGTGASTGRKTEADNARAEGRQGAEIVRWLAQQDWTDGSVGMFGKSYPGLMCLATAAENPDPLEAIIPIHTTAGGYPSRKGGVLDPYMLGGHWHPQMQVLQSLPSSFRDKDGHWADAWNDHLDELEKGTPWLFQRIRHETKDEYWSKKRVNTDRIAVPTFAVSGWRDIGTTSTLDYINDIDAQKRVLMGPWRHTMPHRGREVAINFRQQMVEWFDFFLKDVENDAPEGPLITYWTERNGGGNPNAGSWRQRDEWPRASTHPEMSIEYSLSPAGLVSRSEFERGAVDQIYEHDYSVGMFSVDGFDEPVDTTEDDKRSLCYETDPLSDPVEVTGTGTFTLRLSSSITDPLIVARIIDVGPDGQGTLVTHGRIRASHRNGHSNSDKLQPGEEYQIQVQLNPKSHIFEKGHKIRIAISGAYFPIALPTKKAGSFNIRSTPDNPSFISFPGTVHSNSVDLNNTISMGRPSMNKFPTNSWYVSQTDNQWETSRDHLNDRARVSTTTEKCVDLPHGGKMKFSQYIDSSVRERDPQSVTVSSVTRMKIDCEDEEVYAEVHCRMSRDTTQVSNEVTIDGQIVFDESWHI